MIEIDLMCPNCGGRLEININREKSFCPYCDSEFSVYRKLNQKLKKVKQKCFHFQSGDDSLVASEDVKETQVYRKAQKHLGIPDDDEVFLVYDATIWNTGKRGFAITSKGVYLKGEGMSRPKHLTWEHFKMVSIYGRQELVIGDVSFILDDPIVARFQRFLKEIQNII